MTNSALKRLVWSLDRRFFEGRLRNRICGVQFVSSGFMKGSLGRTVPYWRNDGKTKFRIFINSKIRYLDRVVRGTVQHELMHCDKWHIKDCDDPEFDVEMIKLCLRGGMRGNW